MKTHMTKTVLITGASSGFGRLTAKKFQSEGWNVIATMRKPEKETELNQLPNVLVAKLDVTDRATIKSAISAGLEKFNRIDALINNAGYGTYGYLEEASDEEIERQMRTNFNGVIKTIQEVLPTMRTQKGGVIINITSLAGLIGVPMSSLYNASKFAVQGLSESLNYELSEFGISVKVVAPGAFKTSFAGSSVFTQGNPISCLASYREQFKTHFQAMIASPPKPIGYGDPQDVANLIFKCATRKTKTTNIVGKDAKIIWKIRNWMPSRLLFKMLKSAMLPFYKGEPKNKLSHLL